MTFTHFFRCLSCEKEHGDAEAAAKCCPFMQEIWRCDNCGAEFPNEAKVMAHQKAKPLPECEAMAIAEGIEQGFIKTIDRSYEGSAGCFLR